MAVQLPAAPPARGDAPIALVAGCAAIAMFLPPLLAATTASVLRTVLTALVIAVAVPLHWVFLGVGARRMGQRVLPWVALSALLFPVGAAAALILLGWFAHELQLRQAEPSPAR